MKNHEERVNLVDGVSVIILDSWRTFFEYTEFFYRNSPAFIYRGQASSEWPVNSSIDRLEAKYPKTPLPPGSNPTEFDMPPVARATHLKAFKTCGLARVSGGVQSLDEDQWWALGQHHGLATPMLDWTSSQFVALYFAFEESIEWGETEGKNHRAVYCLTSSALMNGSIKERDRVPRPYLPITESNPRLAAQSGLFLKMPKGMTLEEYVREAFKGESFAEKGGAARCILEKILIPDEGRLDCLKCLNKMNINRMTLFPDLDGSAKHINNLWETGFDSSLGHIPHHLD